MQNNNKIQFSPETFELVQNIIRRYPEGRQKSAVMPILHIAQAEFDGWLSPETMNYVAELLSIKPVEVYEVATFYTMFNLKPVGKCVIDVCQTGPCWLNGADEVISHIEKKLNIKVGETTKDGKFTLRAVECLAACGCAPVIQVGHDYHEFMTIEKTDKLIDEFIKTDKVSHLNPYKI